MEHGPELFANRRHEEREIVVAERDELYRRVAHQQEKIGSLKKLVVDQLPNFGK